MLRANRSSIVRRIALILEQIFISLGNYVLMVYFARKMTEENYGLFSAIMGIYLIIGAIINTIIVETMSIQFVRMSNMEKIKYSFHLSMLSIILSVFTSSIVAIIIAIIYKNISSIEALLLILNLSFLIHITATRRIVYLNIGEVTVFILSAIYLFLILISCNYLRQFNSYSVLFAFEIWGIIGAIYILFSGLLLFFCKPSGAGRINLCYLNRTLIEHWRKSKSLCLGLTIANISSQAQVLLPPFFGSSINGAEIRAFLNLLTPFWQLIQALMSFILPKISHLLNINSDDAAKQLISHESKIIISCGALYSIFLCVCASFLIKFLYSGKYQIHNFDLLILSALPILISINSADAIALRVRQSYNYALFSGIISVPFAIGLAAWGSIRHSTTLLLASILVSTIISILITKYYSRSMKYGKSNSTFDYITA
jgi:O-antigen/teichoic acid export membrane protein